LPLALLPISFRKRDVLLYLGVRVGKGLSGVWRKIEENKG
jgi:hypothetical protein